MVEQTLDQFRNMFCGVVRKKVTLQDTHDPGHIQRRSRIDAAEMAHHDIAIFFQGRKLKEISAKARGEEPKSRWGRKGPRGQKD